MNILIPGAPLPTAAPTSPTAAPTPGGGSGGGGGQACCSWTECNVCEPTGAFCLESKINCESNCGGKWCPNGAGSPIPAPTPQPTNPPTGPTPPPTPPPGASDKCCSWTQCKACQPTSEYCLNSKGNCEVIKLTLSSATFKKLGIAHSYRGPATACGVTQEQRYSHRPREPELLRLKILCKFCARLLQYQHLEILRLKSWLQHLEIGSEYIVRDQLNI